ncbi:hypothetical protein C3B79_0224 [Aeromonas hydrophila]|nr:hypothetical protein C3B79_0224 [Aeromonas hydrophila]
MNFSYFFLFHSSVISTKGYIEKQKTFNFIEIKTKSTFIEFNMQKIEFCEISKR